MHSQLVYKENNIQKCWIIPITLSYLVNCGITIVCIYKIVLKAPVDPEGSRDPGPPTPRFESPSVQFGGPSVQFKS